MKYDQIDKNWRTTVWSVKNSEIRNFEREKNCRVKFPNLASRLQSSADTWANKISKQWARMTKWHNHDDEVELGYQT